MENNTPDKTERDTWEEKSVLSVPLTGRLYKQEKPTVHNIILHNIADASDAFTYVKPYIKKDNVELTSKGCVVGMKTLPYKSSTLARPSVQLIPSSTKTEEQ